MKKYPFLLLVALIFTACSSGERSHRDMIELLKKVNQQAYSPKNGFSPKAKLEHMDSLLNSNSVPPTRIIELKIAKANVLLELGRETDAIELLNSISKEGYLYRPEILRTLGIAYLRLGERENCINGHNAESCILPIRGRGIHVKESSSREAIKIYKELLQENSTDLESKWLINLAYMTLGIYPDSVPSQYLIAGLEGDTEEKVKPFYDIAPGLKLNVRTVAGGSITEDFDNDGYLDLMISGMYDDPIALFRSNGDGTFTNIADKAGLKGITGGLNIMQTDYNNDGHKDVFVLRGGWQQAFGKEPNSLLRNNGDGTFTDVTTVSGLLSFHPTQTATWNDFNNDGWLDVFIGNESSELSGSHPCELYINNGDGTFRDVAADAKCNILKFVKGVTSGDYDNDGWPDLFLSTMNGERILLRNSAMAGGKLSFEDVTAAAGIKERGNSFPTWFWDYDNDGWLDIFACDYTFNRSLGYNAAAERLSTPHGSSNKMFLYHNNGDGTFTEVANEAGLNTNVFAMGSNYGDIDNDGYLDMYLGTGNPSFQSLIPNKMFKNLGGSRFADVTTSARVGHLQKGHGVSFADMDNDGDQDIYIEMGGAFIGDAYDNAFYANQGQSTNNWISIELEGVTANKSAIGSRVIVHVKEDGKPRTIVRDVNSGGSFGSSPLRREIGVGKADVIERIEVIWNGKKTIDTYENVPVNKFIKITQGNSEVNYLTRSKIEWDIEALCGPLL